MKILTPLLVIALLGASPAAYAAQDKPAPRHEKGPDERNVGDYLLMTITGKGEPLHPAVLDGAAAAWLVGALTAALGGHIWAPRVFFKDMPSGHASQQAMILGAVATGLAYLFVINLALHVFTTFWWWVPYLGWIGGSAVQVGLLFLDALVLGALLVLEFLLFPRAVQLACSDAYDAAEGEDDGPAASEETAPKAEAKPAPRKKTVKKPIKRRTRTPVPEADQDDDQEETKAAPALRDPEPEEAPVPRKPRSQDDEPVY